MRRTRIIAITAAAGLVSACASFAASNSPAPATNDLNNPHKGFMLWGTDYADGPPANHYGATIYHVYMPWREIETADNVFDWGAFETNHLLPILDDDPNATFVLRPVADYPDGGSSGITLFYSGGEPERDFPRFLIEAPLSITYNAYADCDGDGPGWTPDWNDAAMVTQLTEFVQAFGQRYDGDPRLTAVQVGLLGLWGEWHQSGCDDHAPSNAVKVAVRDAYAAAFTNTPLQTRYARDPDSIGVDFGFHEDYFPSFTAHCDYGFPSCDDTGDWNLQYGFDHVNPAASNHWTANPISGESPNGAQKTAWSNDFNDVMTVLADYHFSFLGPAGGHERSGNEALLLPMKRRLGYQFHLARIDWPDTADLGHSFDIVVAITNSGAAPCYHPFTVEAALCDAGGAPLWRAPFDFDLRDALPGAVFERTNAFTITNLPPGTNSLRIGILDPRTGEPGVRFQTQGEDAQFRIPAGDLVLNDPWTSDRDGDDLPDEWEFIHFGGFTNAVPEAEPNGDGITTWDFYVSDTDPADSASYLHMQPIDPGPPPSFHFTPGSTGRLYTLQAAASRHAGWSNVPGAGPRAGAGGADALAETNDPPAGAFYRLRVALPEP